MKTSAGGLRKQLIARAENILLADLHVRSKFSGAQLSIPELVDFYGARGFGCIAITDRICQQNGFIGMLATGLNRTLTPALFPIYIAILKSEADRAWKRYRMVVVPGVELVQYSPFGALRGHLLGLGVSRFVQPNKDASLTARELHLQGAVVIAAASGFEEPRLWRERQDLNGEIDAWEVSCGGDFYDKVKSSGLPMIATSALNRPQEINSWKTVLHCSRDQQSILKAIRDQSVEFKFYREVVTGSHNPHPPSFDSGIELLDHSSFL